MYEIKIDSETFLVEIEYEESPSKYCVKGRVLPTFRCSEQLEYVSIDTFAPTLDIRKARVVFKFSFCWRGAWDGRIYFEDEEYWSCELKTMAKVWDEAEQMLKSILSSRNPNIKFEE